MVNNGMSRYILVSVLLIVVMTAGLSCSAIDKKKRQINGKSLFSLEEKKEEKQEAGKEESLKLAEKQAKDAKHTSKQQQVERQVASQRKTLSR